LPWVCTDGGRAVCCYDTGVPIYKGVWRSHARDRLGMQATACCGRFVFSDGV